MTVEPQQPESPQPQPPNPELPPPESRQEAAQRDLVAEAWAAWETEKATARPSYGRVDYEGSAAGRSFGMHVAAMLFVALTFIVVLVVSCLGAIPLDLFKSTVQDRSPVEARAQLWLELGPLIPPAAKDVRDVRSAVEHARSVTRTWYRFELPKDQIEPYRQHLARVWTTKPTHDVTTYGAMQPSPRSNEPDWWDTDEVAHCPQHLLLGLTYASTIFNVALNPDTGHVFIFVGN